MERIKSLNLFQKGIIIVIIVMVLVFIPMYFMTISRVGYEYDNAILIPKEENGNKLYTGKIKGKQAVFTVTKDKTVTFQYGEKNYGPYIVKEDPTILVKDVDFHTDDMIRIEVTKGEDVLFRGGALEVSETWWLYDENGSIHNMYLTYTSSDGIVMDSDGNVIDSLEPSVSTIVDLVYNPKLVHKGSWGFWFLGFCVSIFTIVSILFADEIFRFNLAFRIQNVDDAEPSDWELTTRYFSWILLTIMALVTYIVGICNIF